MSVRVVRLGSPRHPGEGQLKSGQAAAATTRQQQFAEEESMIPNPVRWFEIYVQDVARARAFYEQVFDTQLTQLPTGDLEMWAFPQQSGAGGAAGTIIKAPPGVVSGGNSTLVYFGSDDCAVEAARVEAAGGKLYRDKMSIGQYGYIVLAADPDGNMFGVHSVK